MVNCYGIIFLKNLLCHDFSRRQAQVLSVSFTQSSSYSSALPSGCLAAPSTGGGSDSGSEVHPPFYNGTLPPYSGPTQYATKPMPEDALSANKKAMAELLLEGAWSSFSGLKMT